MGLYDTAILVIDDMHMMSDLIATILRRLGFATVDVAHDGTAGLAMMGEKAYGLVISDVNMEPMGGLKLLSLVRQDPSLKHTPFILMTASLATENVIAAKRAGVDTFLMKPFSPAILRERIVGLLGEDGGRGRAVVAR
ncbi:MAG TPA: response regulator [Beijerinckiaceae bacterium]|jgi:two-component system chemotaxis response regulator CheY